MLELVVNNTNIVVERRQKRDARKHPATMRKHKRVDAQLLKQIESAAKQLNALTCSATWMEDCLYRGREYVPDFQCQCSRCRRKFPDRLHPRPARQSDFSQDCQVEINEDPEFAEDFERLRNSRGRVGSVLVASRLEKNLGRSRRSK